MWEQVHGTIPYIFIEDDSAESGMERLKKQYPAIDIELVDCRPLGTSLTITGSWMDVFRFFLDEYDGCDSADILMNVSCLMAPDEDAEEVTQ